MLDRLRSSSLGQHIYPMTSKGSSKCADEPRDNHQEEQEAYELSEETDYSIHKLLSGRPLSIPGQVDDLNDRERRITRDNTNGQLQGQI